jgi:hypothetical protein
MIACKGFYLVQLLVHFIKKKVPGKIYYGDTSIVIYNWVFLEPDV